VLHQRVEHLAQELRELRSAFAGIGARIAELPGRGDLGAAVDAVAARSAQPPAELVDRLDGVGAGLSALRAQVDAIAARLPAPGQPDADDGAGFERLEASLRDGAQATQERLAAVEQQLAEIVAALTPDEAEAGEAGEPDAGEPAEDPVLTELGELWEALFGDEGLASKVEAAAAAADDVDTRLAESVQEAVSAAEARLSAHIDEAVLALAEALLRRRTTRMGGAARPAPPAATPPDATSPDAGPAAATTQESADDADDADDELEAPEPAAADVGAPWQTPQSAPAAESGSQDADRRRRPWWRPGD